VRIIAATHRNLEDSIAHGTFREDLYHRLNVFPIEMPALRTRIEDLPLLVRDIIAHNMSEGRGQVQLSPLSLAALSLYRWTGNVRELANLIERLSIICSGRVAHVGDLPAKYRPSDWTAVTEPAQIPAAEQHSHVPTSPDFLFGDEGLPELISAGALVEPAAPHAPRPDAATLPADGIDLRAHLTQIERRLIEQALERANGTVAHAARLLGLRRTTLVEKLRKLGLVSAELANSDLATLDPATED
jgi:sigma-54 specific flagellar transcriptional regulator A